MSKKANNKKETSKPEKAKKPETIKGEPSKKKEESKKVDKLSKDIKKANKTLQMVNQYEKRAKKAIKEFNFANRDWGIAETELYRYRETIIDAFFRGDASTADYVLTLSDADIARKVSFISGLGTSIATRAIADATRAGEAYSKMLKANEISNRLKYGINPKKKSSKKNSSNPVRSTEAPIPESGLHNFLDGLAPGYLHSLVFAGLTVDQFRYWSLNGYDDRMNYDCHCDDAGDTDIGEKYTRNVTAIIDSLNETNLHAVLCGLPYTRIIAIINSYLETFRYGSLDDKTTRPEFIHALIDAVSDIPEYQKYLKEEREKAAKDAVSKATLPNDGQCDSLTALAEDMLDGTKRCLSGRVLIGEFIIASLRDMIISRLTKQNEEGTDGRYVCNIIQSRMDDFTSRFGKALSDLYSAMSLTVVNRLFIITYKEDDITYYMVPSNANGSLEAYPINAAIAKEICNKTVDILIDFDDEDAVSDISMKDLMKDVWTVISDSVDDTLMSLVMGPKNAMEAAAEFVEIAGETAFTI